MSALFRTPVMKTLIVSTPMDLSYATAGEDSLEMVPLVLVHILRSSFSRSLDCENFPCP